jgi:hypothetical protein
VTQTISLETRLSVVLDHAERLRSTPYTPANSGHLLQWPDPPGAVRGRRSTKLAIAAAAIGALFLGTHAWAAAEVAFGHPARPTLVGHKIGSPWHDASPTADPIP